MSDAAVREAIASVEAYYRERGIFRTRFGFGARPALLVIDMANGWTDPAYAVGSARLDEAVAGIARLLPLCRERGVPVVYTTSPFRPDEVNFNPGGTEGTGRFRPWDERACAIDARLEPAAGEWVLRKETASAFFGTPLASYLIERGVDTVLVTGCSTSACVRATATDARAYRFHTIIPRQCVQDRAPAAHAWNLFDLDAKFADVVDVEEVASYLRGLAPVPAGE